MTFLGYIPACLAPLIDGLEFVGPIDPDKYKIVYLGEGCWCVIKAK